MYKKLNNKGYMLIEIIFASVIAFSVAYYLMNLTYKFKNMNEDVYYSTTYLSDKILIEKNIMNDIGNQIISDCKINGNTIEIILLDNTRRKININTSTKTITYSSSASLTGPWSIKYLKTLESSVEMGDINIISENKYIKISIPVTSRYSEKQYDIKLFFMIGEKPISAVELGEYITYIPTKTSVSIDSSVTGYTDTPNQTINPSGLTKWRVLKKNADGTIEIISVDATSSSVYFEGKTGYMNLAKALNDLAQEFLNTTYTTKARHFGSNEQTPKQTPQILDTNQFSSDAPWACSTGGVCTLEESKGAGDEVYTIDYNNVKNILGNANSSSYYWTPSRYYQYTSSTSYKLQTISISGTGTKYVGTMYTYNDGTIKETRDWNCIRPIVTLKSTLKLTGGVGTSDSPYTLGI